MSGETTASETAAAKWDRIWHQADSDLPRPARVLIENAHLLPASGLALDLACGLGGNALFLARRGLSVRALDISPVAIERLKAWASRYHFDLTAEVLDVETMDWPEDAFDVIVVSRFLARALCPRLIAALKPGGMLFCQTYIRDKLASTGPSNPDFLLDPNELLRLFQPLHLLVYREEGRCGDLARGFRDEAMLVGRKAVPSSASE
jgi:SAM-dependent methyltransferase